VPSNQHPQPTRTARQLSAPARKRRTARLIPAAAALAALPLAVALPASAAQLPSAMTGAAVVLDRGAAIDLSDAQAAVDRAGTTYVAWSHRGTARLCVLPAGAARCARTSVLPAAATGGVRPVLGSTGTVTLVWTQARTLLDSLVATTSTDGGVTFPAATPLAELPPQSRLLSLASAGGALLTASVSPVGLTVRAVRLDQDAPATGPGAAFPVGARDATVALSSIGPVLAVRVPGKPPLFSRYGGEGTADDSTGWTPLRSFAGVDDALATTAAGDDPVLVNRAGAGRRLQVALFNGASFGRPTPLDAGGSGVVTAATDSTGRVTVVRAGGSAAGLVASATARGSYPVDTPPVFSTPVRVLVQRPATGSSVGLAVAGSGSGVVVARAPTATGSVLVLQRFSVPVPVAAPAPGPKTVPPPRPTVTPTVTPTVRPLTG